MLNFQNQSTMNEHNLLGKVSGGNPSPIFISPNALMAMTIIKAEHFQQNLQAWSSEIIAGAKFHPTPVIKETLGLWRQFHILTDFYCKRDT